MPDREFCNKIEIVCDEMLKAYKLSKVASVGIPVLDIMVQCATHKDNIDTNLNVGIFHIPGKDLARKSIKEVKDYIDERIDN